MSSMRDSHGVLTLDADYEQTLVSTRSLGRVGLRVALGECFAECEPSLPVLAFCSRYSACNVVLPSYAVDPLAFANAVIEFVRPQVDSIDDQSVILAEFEFPFVLKPTISWAEQLGHRLVPVEVIDEREAVKVTQRVPRRRFRPRCPGMGLRSPRGRDVVHGRRRSPSQLRAHSVQDEPPLGGASVMRESIPTPQDIYAASVRLTTAAGIQDPVLAELRTTVAAIQKSRNLQSS
jgi:hypothetical protein